MEAFFALIGLVAGWVLSQLTLSLESVRELRTRWRADKRQLYGRLLAASDSCYRTTDLVVNWKTQTQQATTANPSAPPARRTRSSTNVTALSETVTELESHLRASRQLFAEIRLIAAEDVIDSAEPLHRAAEEAMLLVKFSTGEATTRNRWIALQGTWREAREEFERVARGDLGTTVGGGARGWLRWPGR